MNISVRSSTGKTLCILQDQPSDQPTETVQKELIKIKNSFILLVAEEIPLQTSLHYLQSLASQDNQVVLQANHQNLPTFPPYLTLSNGISLPIFYWNTSMFLMSSISIKFDHIFTIAPYFA
jgi:hypothetical protein